MKRHHMASRQRHWLTLLIATLLLSSLVSPWQLATAQADGDQIETMNEAGDTPAEEPAEEPVAPEIPTDPPAATEPPPTEVVVIPTEMPDMGTMSEPEPGYLSLIYHTCPLGTDLETADLETVCTGIEDANFDLRGLDPGATYSTGQRTNNSFAEFHYIPPGAYQLSLPGHPGWPMAAWCDVLDSPDPNRGNTRPYTQRNITNAALNIEVEEAEVISCRWFAVNPMESGEMALTAFQCPSGLETIRYDHADLVMQCTEAFSPVSFLIAGGSQNIERTLTTNPPGAPEWPNGVLVPELPTGYYDVWENLTGDYRLGSVFCRVVPIADMNPQASFNRTPFDDREGYRIDPEIVVNQRAECHFFNEYNLEVDMYLAKYTCPDGVDVEMASRGDLRDACSYLMEPVDFVITSDSMVDTTSTDQGLAESTGLPPGEISIREILPKSTRLAAVYCAATPLKDRDNPGYQPMWDAYTPDATDTVKVNTEPRDQVECEFYNVADDGEDREEGYAAIEITKYTCDQEIDWSMASRMDLQSDCMAEPGEVAFTVIAGDHHDQDVIDRDSMVRFMDVPTHYGPVTVTEYPRSDAVLQAVYCSLDGNYQPYPYTGPAISYALVDGDRLSCEFYNAIGQDPEFEDYQGTVTVYKWNCPEGTSSSMEPGAYPGTCTTPADGIDFNLADANGTTRRSTLSGMVQWEGVVADALGSVSLHESIPAGYGSPMVVCQDETSTSRSMPPISGSIAFTPPAEMDWEYTCQWYNIPEPPATVTLHKWDCPEGVTIDRTLNAHQSACTIPLDGVTFTLTSSAGSTPLTTMGGMATWTGIPLGVVTIAEDLPLGYSPQPYVSCATVGNDAPPLTYTVVNEVVTLTLDTPGQNVRCDWFNQYLGAGEITIAKWLCPAGYDYSAWQSDPRTGCSTPLSDVTFTINGPSGTYQGNTNQQGAVTFGTLQPGTWEVQESIPSGIAGSFVWNCTGLRTSAVHPAPLATGSSLTVTVAAGDRITCNWMNVPPSEPTVGWLALNKYTCTTSKYQSEIDCYRAGVGHTFDLQLAQGQAWTTVATGTTDAAGQVTFSRLTPGTYRLVERGATPCLVKSSAITTNGYIGVNAGSGTTVKVYNCGSPVPPAKTPTKFPNTGVAPTGSGATTTIPGGAAALPAVGAMLAVARTRRSVVRMALGGSVVAGAAMLSASRTLGAQDVVPLDIPATPDAETAVDDGCLYPATSDEVIAGTPVACTRGAVPVQVVIPAIDVDAPIEYLDFIDGEMEPPSGEIDVAWYKRSARLGEVGNILLAGHLNWWGVPKAVFFRLATLQPGDLIEVMGDNDATYRYLVDWVEPFPAAEPPPDEALGDTDNESLTLITCGGEWDVSAAEYNQRSVVRAIREDLPPA